MHSGSQRLETTHPDHEGHEGHLGIVKVKQRCRGLVWWPGIDRDVEAIVGFVTTRVVIDFLSSLFARSGVPDAVTTNNGPQFISANFAAFVEERGIKHFRTAFYHPQANGEVQGLKNRLRAHLAGGSPFSALKSTLLHYRATPHTTTGRSPAVLMGWT